MLWVKKMRKIKVNRPVFHISRPGDEEIELSTRETPYQQALREKRGPPPGVPTNLPEKSPIPEEPYEGQDGSSEPFAGLRDAEDQHTKVMRAQGYEPLLDENGEHIGWKPADEND
jgi:hypothetical protein